MKVILTASSGAEIVVWRERDTYFARPPDDMPDVDASLTADHQRGGS